MRIDLRRVLISAPGRPAASALMPSAVRSAWAGTSESDCSACSRASRTFAFGRLVLPGRRHPGAVRVGGEDALQQAHRRDAVDEGVVELGVHRDPAVAQALDQVPLPQRALGGEAGRVQSRAQLEQLADPTGLRQRAVAHVVLDVELVVLAPDVLPAGAHRPHRVLEEQRGDVVGLAELAVEVVHVVAPRALGLGEQLAARRRASASAGSPPSGTRRRSDPGDAPCRRS